MTDLWDYAEAAATIVNFFSIDFMYADDTNIKAGYCVKFGSSGSNKCPVAVTSSIGDGFGVALKTPVAIGDMIPVLIIGVHKFYGGNVKPTIGKGVMNSYLSTGDYVVGTAGGSVNNWARYGGSSYVLGYAMQTVSTYGDEILVLMTGGQ